MALYRCAATSCPGYPYKASTQAHPPQTCGPLAERRHAAHARLTEAFTEGERDVRARMATALHQLAETIDRQPPWVIQAVAAMLRSLRDDPRIAHRETSEGGLLDAIRALRQEAS